jgi:hypothetical protein
LKIEKRALQPDLQLEAANNSRLKILLQSQNNNDHIDNPHRNLLENKAKKALKEMTAKVNGIIK